MGEEMAEASRSIPKHCAGTRKDGSRCTARVMGEGAYCFAHDPARADDRDAAREKGGRAKSSAARAGKLVPAMLRPVLDGLFDVFEKVKAGTLDPRTGTALASIAGAIVKVHQVGTLEERLAAIERALAAADEQGAG